MLTFVTFQQVWSANETTESAWPSRDWEVIIERIPEGESLGRSLAIVLHFQTEHNSSQSAEINFVKFSNYTDRQWNREFTGSIHYSTNMVSNNKLLIVLNY